MSIVHEDAKLENTALHFYYTKLFPLNKMVEWLAYENSQDAGKKALARREFSLSIPANDGGEIYMRWLCFTSADAWAAKLIADHPYPHKMDIGAIYTLPLSMKELQPHRFAPLEKEVVFDIDMNDYDEFRTCCTGKTICNRCWRFMTLAMEILDTTFRDDYGFKNILWVYSGRRGIHAWICDREARRMNNTSRVAMVQYLSIVNERASKGVGVRLYDRSDNKQDHADELTHPVFRRAKKLCTAVWEDILNDQNIFAGNSEKCSNARNRTRQHLGTFGELFDQAMSMNADYNDSPDYSVRVWKALKNNKNEKLRQFMDEIAVGFCYPRLDVNVTKDVGHLLKAPFCAHPGTGRICVPIDPTQNGRDGRPVFNPKSVPTIPGLQQEYRVNGDGATSLQRYLDFFESNFLAGLASNKENDVIMEE